MTASTTSKTECRDRDRMARFEAYLTARGDNLERWRSVIEKMDKRRVILAAKAAAEEKRCAIEEEPYGGLSDQPASGSPFLEKPFGSEVARGEKHYRTSANDTRDLSSIVVSLALFDGDKMLFACSGIPLPHGRTALRLTRFVTSARLVTAYNANRNRDDNLRVEVRLPDNTITGGLLGLYDQQIAIVTTLDLPTRHAIDLNPQDPASSRDDRILAAGRAFSSGSLMATHGSLCENPPTWVSDDPGITEAVFGGPVIGNGDRFIGMSLHIDDSDNVNGRNVWFLRREILCKRLEDFGILNPKKIDFRGYSLPSGVSSIVPSGFRKVINRIKSLGYPMPPPLVLELNGELLNQFEGHFGDLRAWEGFPWGVSPIVSEERVWQLLQKEVVSDISQRVVSLKSFNGHGRHFACTGLVIWWPESSSGACSVILTSANLVGGHNNEDNVYDSMIEVFLPPNQTFRGTLEWYNSNYNIALVSVEKNFCASPENIFNTLKMPSRKDLPKRVGRGKVVAIGRDTEEGLLMASIGEVKQRNKHITLDCRYLKLSTCKINKAGIGGPLINFGGSLVGMNFYDGREETPFLPRSRIVEVLKRVVAFPLPSRVGDFAMHIKYGARGRTRENRWRWPVPEPFWFHGELDVDRFQLPKLPGRTLQ